MGYAAPQPAATTYGAPQPSGTPTYAAPPQPASQPAYANYAAPTPEQPTYESAAPEPSYTPSSYANPAPAANNSYASNLREPVEDGFITSAVLMSKKPEQIAKPPHPQTQNIMQAIRTVSDRLATAANAGQLKPAMKRQLKIVDAALANLEKALQSG